MSIATKKHLNISWIEVVRDPLRWGSKERLQTAAVQSGGAPGAQRRDEAGSAPACGAAGEGDAPTDGEVTI